MLEGCDEMKSGKWSTTVSYEPTVSVFKVAVLLLQQSAWSPKTPATISQTTYSYIPYSLT